MPSTKPAQPFINEFLSDDPAGTGWVPPELQGRNDLNFYRQRDLGYGQTQVTLEAGDTGAPTIPGKTWTGDMNVLVNRNGDWAQLTYADNASVLEPSVLLGTKSDGGQVWSAGDTQTYPVSLNDGVEVRALPAYAQGGSGDMRPSIANARALGFDSGNAGVEFMAGWRGDYHSVMSGPVSGYETAGRYAGAAADSFRNFASSMTGAGSMNRAVASWKAGNYGASVIQGATSFVEAGSTVLSFGAVGATRGIISSEVAAARAGSVANSAGNRGLTFVGENLGTPRNAAMQAARDFESGTTGAFSDIATRQRQVPALRFDNPKPNGAPYVKFDGHQQLDNGIIELIDSKTRIVPFATKEGPFISSLYTQLTTHNRVFAKAQPR